ncbi:MAG: endonuclease MutS2, partial [Anaerolineae bacterium]|nr:endonuclease MutS2 [Anaerolineae bacterium]
VRQAAQAAGRGVVLTPVDLLDIKSTLISARTLGRRFESENEYPRLAAIAKQLPPPLGLVDAISKTISDRGELLDSASAKLSEVRRDLKISHQRLIDKLEAMVKNAKITPHLQEALVTQREGRYVLPVRAESKGKVKGVVHDQSSSGATLFVEPLASVDLNNKWRELQLSERDEELRILQALSVEIGEHAAELEAAVQVLAELDLAFAKAKYADDLDANPPELVKFSPKKDATHPGVRLKLWQARHPLLDPETVVPIDIELDPQTYVIVITGPNTGGKTVTLKTVGLLALMAQAGLHVPAQAGSELCLFEDIYADIGDEQSIEQSLSTFSGHITNIIHILDKAGAKSLVIIDELGAGTDPQEGAALARALLGHLTQAGITTLVATHYPELKSYAHATPGVANASVEFDLETLRPTYHLTVGLPGRSNALAIAQRLGLQDEIVESARSTIDPDELRAEDLLDEIHRQRDLTRSARQEAESARKESQEMRRELAERLENIEDERLEILGDARRTAQREVETIEEEIRKTHRELKRARQPLDVIEQAAKQTADIKQEVSEQIEREAVPESAPDRPLRLGDRVHIRSLDKEGVVSAIGTSDAEVQVGALRVRARMADIHLLGEGRAPAPEWSMPEAGGFSAESPGVELSIRGLRVDEAMDELDGYLDQAYLAGMPYVRIIHGKGTGRLKEAVRKELSKRKEVERYETGGPREGGDGVTVAFFKQ